MPNKVNLIRKDGTVIAVDEGKVATLLAYGYRLEAPEEELGRNVQAEEKEHFSGIGQQALAGVEGLASGATLGASDVALSAFGADTSKRADYNPGTRIGTEIAGALLTAIPTGGASLEARGALGTVKALARSTPSAALSRGATALGERVAGKGLAGKLVGGAVEGGVAGVGFEASRAALADDPFTVESAIAGATLGSFFGAGAMGVAHGVGGVVNRVRGRATARTGDAALDALGGLDEVGGGVDDYMGRQGMAPSLEADFTRKLESIKLGKPVPASRPTTLDISPPRTHSPGTTARQISADISKGLVPDSEFAKLSATVDDIGRQTDTLLEQTKAAHNDLVKASTDRGHLSASDVMTKRANAARDAADPVLNETMLKGSESARNLAKTARSQWKYVEKAIRDGDATQLDVWLKKHKESSDLLAEAAGTTIAWPQGPAKLATSLKDIGEFALAAKSLKSLPATSQAFFELTPAKAEEMFGAISRVLSSGVPEALPIQGSLQRVLEQMADRAGVRIEAQGADVVSRLRTTWAVGREAGAAAEGKFFAESAAEQTRQQGLLGGESAWEPNIGGPNKPWSKQEGSGTGHPQGVKYKTPDDEFATSNPKAKKAGAERESLGDVVTDRIKRAAAYGALGAIMPGATMAKAALMGILMAGKGRAVAALEKAVLKVGPGMSKVAARGAKVYPLAKNLSGMPDREYDMKKAYAARSAELREMFSSAKDRAFLTAQDLSAAGHPEFAFAAYTASLRALDVVMKKLPKDPVGTRWGTESIWQAPEEQMVVFSQEYSAASAPVDFLVQALSDPSSVFPSAIEVVEEAWPALYNNFRSQVLIRLGEVGTRGMSHQDLVSLGIILGTALEPLSTPENIQDSMAMFQMPPPAPAAPQVIPAAGAQTEATASQLQGNR